MPYKSRFKGYYLFGGDAAESCKDRLGGAAAVPTVGAGGITYGANYLDLRQGSSILMPFNSVPRDRTVFLVSTPQFEERVFDGDATFKWPPTVSPSAAMTSNTGHYELGWNANAQSYGWVGSAHSFRGETGFAATTSTYQKTTPTIGYKDATFDFVPALKIIGHGPAGGYMYVQCGRALERAEFVGVAASPPASAPTKLGARIDGAGEHQVMMAFAEASYLTEAEALIAGRKICADVEARGWTGFSHYPEDGAAG
ncbi:hypothetical protein [Mesorhizobium sp. M0959]|uniref:hypothetical protein n=1 Tax=unclassified Mesorhizobium TaxID=325217 RepID=UPI00333A490C